MDLPDDHHDEMPIWQGTIVSVAVSNSAMFSHFYAVDYVMLLVGVLLCAKKVAELEWSRGLRMLILTLILGATLLFYINAFVSALDNNFEYDGADHFTLSEI